MRNLAICVLSTIVLAGCGQSPEAIETSAPEETTETAIQQEAEAVAETVEAVAVSKEDAENYMLVVQYAVDEVKKFNRDTDMDSYKIIQDRMNKIRDDGDKFEGSDFEHCRMLATYPLDTFYAAHRKDSKDSMQSHMKLYKQVKDACQKQIDNAS